MTTAQSWRRERARQTEALVAEWFAAHGWPDAEPVGPYQAGTDIRKMPGIYVSVKACAELRPRPWVRDAEAAAGDALAFVVCRPKNYGPKTIDRWPVFLSHQSYADRLAPAMPRPAEDDYWEIDMERLTTLLHGAGYGNAG